MGWDIPDYELSYNNREDVLRLPVNPQDPPELYTPGNNQTWVTTDVGTFMAIGAPGLQSLSLESFFPNPERGYDFVRYSDYPTPDECVALIEKWQKSKRPIRLIITGFLNDAFAIEGFTKRKEIATGDVYFTLDLQRYRFASDANPQTGNNNREDDSLAADVNDDGSIDKTVHKIALVKGTTLCEIAEEWLGDSDRYMDVYEWNKDTMTDPGHPWNYEMEEAGIPQYVTLNLKEGEPGYDRVVHSYTGKHADEL